MTSGIGSNLAPRMKRVNRLTVGRRRGFPSRMPRLVGSLVRIVLLIPLLAGARADCSMTDAGPAQARTAGAAVEPGCHSTEAQPSDRGDAPAGPHSGGPLSEHCPAYHSCA